MSFSMRRLACFLFFAALLTGSISASAQIYRTSDQYIQGVKVTYGGRELTCAWAGGLNNPQFALADIDHDGKPDVVVLEAGKGMKTFRNMGVSGETKYLYSPNMEYLLPEARGYLKLLDYNGDNVPDMFHRGNSGLEICDGYYNSSNLLTFKNCREIRYIHSPFSGWVNISVNTDDIPVALDVDRDGDVDILSYNQLDNDMVLFYRNMTREENLPAGTFKLKLVTSCWGKAMTKYALNREHELGLNCIETAAMKPSSGGQNKTTGSGPHAFTLFNVDGDGDYDMLDGYADYAEIQMLTNGKADLNYPIDSMIAQDTMWAPNGAKVYMPRFPVAHWLDMDSDGDSDLVITPHKVPLRENTEDKKCVAYYRNTGTPTAPSYVYQSDSLLVSDMVDLGSDSKPVVYDYDKDGKQDLLVGAIKYNTVTGGKIAQLAFLKNTSTGGSLSFDVQTTNLLNIHTTNFDGVAPAIGDLDNDGVDDMVIGKSDGTLSYYRNFAASNSVQPVWQQWQANMTTKFGTIIDVTEYAAPCFYDVDKDGKKDLVVGNATGNLSYFRNEGAIPGEIKLVEVTNKLGGVFVGRDVGPYNMSAPYIGRIDNTQQDYLLVGNNYGVIAKYSGVEKGYNNNAPYIRVDSAYSDIHVKGAKASPVIGNIDGDTLMREMYVGNSNGGLFTYMQIFNENISDAGPAGHVKLNIYPNPAHNLVHVNINGDLLYEETTKVSLYNNMGQKTHPAGIHINKNIITINTENLSQGVYLCTVAVKGKIFSGIFLKQ